MRMERIRQRVEYFLIRAFISLIGHLPRQFAYRFCEAIASLVFRLDKKHQAIGMVNLRIAFPKRDDLWRRRILEQSFRQLGTHLVEIARLERFGSTERFSGVSYDPASGLENYYAGKSRGKGVIFLTAHISSWEILPSAHASKGNPLSFVVRPLKNSFLDAWSLRLRSRFGNRVISKYGSLRQLLKVLQSGGDIGLLIDQNVQEKDGVYAPFFGRPACTTASAAALALRTGAPVVLGFLVPGKEKGRYLIRFYPPLEFQPTEDHERDLLELTTQFNRCIEQVIRENPSCWLWGHRRFRTQPPGVTDPYE